MNAQRTAWAYLHQKRIEKARGFSSYAFRYQKYIEKWENRKSADAFIREIWDLPLYPEEVMEAVKEIAAIEMKLKIRNNLYSKRFIEAFRMHYEKILLQRHNKYRPRTIERKELRIDRMAYYLAKQCVLQETIHREEKREVWQEWPWVMVTLFLLARTEGILALATEEGYVLSVLKPIEKETYTKAFMELLDLVLDGKEEADMIETTDRTCKVLLEVESLEKPARKIIGMFPDLLLAFYQGKPEVLYSLCKAAELFDAFALKEYEDYFQAAGFL